MGQIGSSARRGAPRDVEHRASVATMPRGRFAPPKAGFFCALASLRRLPDAQASRAAPRLAEEPICPIKLIPIYREPL